MGGGGASIHNTVILKVYKFLVRLAKTSGLLIKKCIRVGNRDWVNHLPCSLLAYILLKI